MTDHQPQWLARLLLLQLGLTLVMALVALALGLVAAGSALVGGLIAAISGGVFARGFTGAYRADQPGHLLGRIYLAQLRKLLVTGLLFAAAFHWLRPLSAGWLLVTFMLVYLLPLLVAHRLRSPRRG